MLKTNFAFLFVCLSLEAVCQKVELIKTTLLNGPDGITLDKAGNLYVANWGKNGDGTSVIKIEKNGRESVFMDGLRAPDGLAFNKSGELYISCFGSGDIIKVGTNKKKTTLVQGLDHPSDIKFDKDGNLFVSSFGNFNGNKIYKIEKDNSVKIFADSLKVPLGLVFNKSNELFVSNFASGEIFKFDLNGQKEKLAQLSNGPPGYFQYLAFDKEGNLYCPSFGHNCIYKINDRGEVSKLVLRNNSEEEFTLNGPNSIYIRDGVLYFTEFNTNSIYRVRLD